MYNHVIWPEQYDRRHSAIYALNDIDVKDIRSEEIPSLECGKVFVTLLGILQSGHL